jgi:hypothetical protein
LGKTQPVLAEIFELINRGCWVGSSEIIMPLCGPSCKLRLVRDFQLGWDSKIGRVWQYLGLFSSSSIILNNQISQVELFWYGWVRVSVRGAAIFLSNLGRVLKNECALVKNKCGCSTQAPATPIHGFVLSAKLNSTAKCHSIPH